MILEQIMEQLTETLKTRVLTLFGHAVDRVVLQSPPKLAMGDLATLTFPFRAGQESVETEAPAMIAQEAAPSCLGLPGITKAVGSSGGGFPQHLARSGRRPAACARPA